MPETFTVLLLAVWVGAIAFFVSVERAEKILWIPVVLAVAGLFSAILPRAISFNVAVVANGATMILFMVSLGILNPGYRLTIARIRYRTHQ